MGESRANVVSSFTIIKGALISETYAAFRQWDLTASLRENLAELKKTNAIGAKSVNWLRDVIFVIQRRFDPSGRDRTLVELAQADCSLAVWKPLLLWHMTRDEFLVCDFLVTWLYKRFREGAHRLRAEEVLPYLSLLATKGVVGGARWTASTSRRVAAGLLRIAADFDLLRGSSIREFASYRLPEGSFLYLLHAIYQQEKSAGKMLDSADWRMFLMSQQDVEAELLRLHQFRKLHYEVAGSLVQLQLPYASAAECAQRLVA